MRSSPAKSGLGLDMWILRLLGTLPDEALSILLDIIHLAFRGGIPMQLILTLIGLIPNIAKSDGGEKAHCYDSHAVSCVHAAVQRHLRQMGQHCCRALGYCS